MIETRYTIQMDYRDVARNSKFMHQGTMYANDSFIGDWPPFEPVYIEADRCTVCKCYLDKNLSCDNCLGG